MPTVTRDSSFISQGMTEVLSMLCAAPDAVLPDPKVAAIILDRSLEAIARYNKTKFGEPHSEAKVVLKSFETIIRKCKGQLATDTLNRAKSLLKAFRTKLFTPGSIRSDSDLLELRQLADLLDDPLGSATLFVNLEPCSHFGKNPACTSIIIAAGIKTVHLSHFDPDPDIKGKGYQTLRSHGTATSVGCFHKESMSINRLFLQIAWFMPRLFGGIHPTANPQDPPYVMIGLHVPRSEIRSKDLGKNIQIHTFGVPPRRTTIQKIQRSGSPRIKPSSLSAIRYDPDSVLFTTLLNPPAIIEMIYRRFKIIPGAIISAVPDMSFVFGKEDCIQILRDYCPNTHVCVGVRMASIQDKLARISLRRRLMVERNKQEKIAIVVLAKGVPPDQKQRVETRYVELVSATTLHVSRFEEYLIMLKFLRDNIKCTIYISGGLFAGSWREKTIENLKKLMIGRKNFEIRCTDEEVVNVLKEAGVPRVKYLDPYWEII